MQLTINVPDSIVRDYETTTGRELDAGFAELAISAFYVTHYDSMYKPILSEQALAALYGDEDCAC